MISFLVTTAMAVNQMLPADLVQRLARVIAARFGSGARVDRLERVAGGHAGTVYSFEFRESPRASPLAVILKIGAPGVRRVGVSDLFRQARLLRVLAPAGISAPRLVWAEEGDEELGAPYIVMERLRGHVRFPLLAEGEDVSSSEAEAVWTTAVDALASLSDPAVVAQLGDWERPTQLSSEFARWEATLRKAPDQGWIDAGLQARDALERTMPSTGSCVVVHGDYQPSNLMFDEGRLAGIIDWDLAQLGSAGLDLGWLMMFADPSYWGDHWRVWSPIGPGQLLRRFAQSRPPAQHELAWFHAFAGYRFGAISCLNVRLHRTGRRHDPVWERFALDIPRLFNRARVLAAGLGTT